MRHLLCLLLVCGLSSWIVTVPAFAQQTTAFDLAIAPSVVEIALQPGKLVNQAFSIENNGEMDLEVTAVLRDFHADNATGNPVLDDTTTFPFASLQNAEIALNQPFHLPKNSSEQLVLAVKVPEDAQERDWYVSLVLQTRPSQETQLSGSGSQVTGQIAANLLIRVSQTNQVPLHWSIDLKGLPRFVDSLQSITTRPFVTNDSSTMGVPEFHLVVLDSKNAIVHEQDGLPDRVLAKSTREIFGAKQRKDDPRSYEAIPFSFNPLFALGPYTVRATVRNGAGGPVVAEHTYFAFPFSLCLGGIALGVLLAFTKYLTKRHSFSRST